VTVSVTGLQPIGSAVTKLEQIYGVPINYEDPITVNENRMEAQTSGIPNASAPSRRVMVQKTETLSFTYRLPKSLPSWGGNPEQFQAESKKAVADALTSVLANYAASGAPEHFSVKEENGMFVVVPTNYLNIGGNLQTVAPMTDAKIAIPAKTRTRGEFLDEVCNSLSITTHVHVSCVFQLVDPRILQEETVVSGSDVTAHSLLDQLFAEMNAPKKGVSYIFGPNGERVPKEAVFHGPPGAYSWKLCYMIGEGYVLNVGHTSVADN
jgi:hypothetical protein